MRVPFKKALYCMIVMVALGLILRLTVCSPMVLPADEKVVEQFRRTKHELIELKTLLDTQPAEIALIAPEGVERTFGLRVSAAEAGMSPEVYADFTKRMKRAGVGLMFRRNGEVAFSIYVQGFASKGYRVLYVFRETAPEYETIKSLGDFRRGPSGWTTAYRHLDGGWYVKVIW